MVSPNYYGVLSLPDFADLDSVKKAYKLKALETHPDKNQGDSAKFLQVQEAYQMLLNNKAVYDSHLAMNTLDQLSEKLVWLEDYDIAEGWLRFSCVQCFTVVTKKIEGPGKVIVECESCSLIYAYNIH